MNWFKLKDNKCPKCNKDLEFHSNSYLITCSGQNCVFQISKERLQEIVSGMVSDGIEKEYAEKNG